MLNKISNIWATSGPMFINGTIVTLKISIFGTIVGLIIGLLVGTIRTIPKQKGSKGIFQKIINAILSLYILVFRGTPMMVQSMLIFYGMPILFNVTLDKMLAAYFIVSINTGAYMSEVVRGGIIGVDKGQFEAATSSGMSHLQTMLYIVIPQTMRNILPATGNEFVINIKDTSVLNVIAINELFFASKSIGGASGDYFSPMLITSIIYLLLTTIITNLLRWIERKMEGPETYELSMGNQMQV